VLIIKSVTETTIFTNECISHFRWLSLLAKSLLTEQLMEVKSLKEDFPQYENLLDFNQKILEAIISIGELSNFGLNKSFDEDFVTGLKEKTLSSRKPMNYFLEPSFFETVLMLEATIEITSSLQSLEADTEGLETFHDVLENKLIDHEKGIKAVLEEDFDWFNNLSKKYGVEASL
jgi:hypothetical protein